jgi:hypothetical protein
MEILELKKDMKVFCVQAESFPNEIKTAFSTLINILPTIENRTFFGISYQGKNHEMIYNAAVLEAYEGEGKKYGCETYVIKKGQYLSEMLTNWKQDETSIGQTFKRMSEERNDVMFPCVEWYQGEDVMCMVRLEQRRS